MVYANLALAGLDEDQYQAALRNINAIRAMADSAVQSIGKTVGGVTDELEEMQNGLNDILDYVMDMLKQRIQDQIDGLEDMKDAYLQKKGLSEYGIAGLMGNLFAESGLNPRNLQNSYENVLGMNDNAYVAAVDNGTYTNFVQDKAGFGLAQWTFWTRKQALLDFAKASGKSIGDLIMQLDFLWKELSGSYPGVLAVLRAATSVLEASNAVLLNFEKPANQSKDVQKRRAEYGQRYYDQFASQTAPASDTDLEQFRKLFQEMRAELQDNDCGQWSAEARQWALDMGLITGNGTVINGEPNYMWQDLVTREQFVTVLYRLAQIMGSPA